MTIYNKEKIINLLALVANGTKSHIIADKHNAKNFVKVARMAKAEFIVKGAINGSITIGIKQ